MNLDTTVYRYSFYNAAGSGKTLRFDEVYPPLPPHEDHSICGCTETTQVRPEGDPEIQVGVRVKTQIKERAVTINIDESSISVNFRWDDPELEDSRGHASFRFYDDKMAVEVTGKDRGISDCTLGYAYFGNQTDMSKLVNGHMPSLMIDPASLSPDAVWVHDSCWGFEAVSMLPIHANETIAWRSIRNIALDTQWIVVQRLNPEVSVEEIHRDISPFLHPLKLVIDSLLEIVIENPDDSDLIRRIMYVDTTAGLTNVGESSHGESEMTRKIRREARKARRLLSEQKVNLK